MDFVDETSGTRGVLERFDEILFCEDLVDNLALVGPQRSLSRFGARVRDQYNQRGLSRCQAVGQLLDVVVLDSAILRLAPQRPNTTARERGHDETWGINYAKYGSRDEPTPCALACGDVGSFMRLDLAVVFFREHHCVVEIDSQRSVHRFEHVENGFGMFGVRVFGRHQGEILFTHFEPPVSLRVAIDHLPMCTQCMSPTWESNMP